MRRGTTPTHRFTLPLHKDDVKAALVTYAQEKTIVVEKKLDDATWEGENTMVVTLSQEDTLKFDPGTSVRFQVRVLMSNDKSIASQIYTRQIDDVLNSEVLV